MNFIIFLSEKNFMISGVCLSGVCIFRSLSWHRLKCLSSISQMQRSLQLDILQTNTSIQYKIIVQNNNRCKEQYSRIFFRKQVRAVQNYYSKQQQMQREVQYSKDIFQTKKSVQYNIIIIIVVFDMAITLESSLLKIQYY